MNFPAPTIVVISACNNPVGRPQKIRLSADAVKKEVRFMEKDCHNGQTKGEDKSRKYYRQTRGNFSSKDM